MRLIDAEILKSQLYESILVNEDMDCLDFLRVSSLIDAQPTAYDIDKIVEELKNHKDTTDLTTVDEEMVIGFTVYQGAFNDGIEQAIEIVKQGGVSDDVCEWKLKDACYTSSIKHYDALPTSIIKTFTNCPYCGKKIKVVE